MWVKEEGSRWIRVDQEQENEEGWKGMDKTGGADDV